MHSVISKFERGSNYFASTMKLWHVSPPCNDVPTLCHSWHQIHNLIKHFLGSYSDQGSTRSLRFGCTGMHTNIALVRFSCHFVWRVGQHKHLNNCHYSLLLSLAYPTLTYQRMPKIFICVDWLVSVKFPVLCTES